jgi:cytochrome c-type biogenesis protein
MFADLFVYFGVAFAGFITFLSPCVLPLVPPYLCYIGGTSIEQLQGRQALDAAANRRIITAAVAFVLGFTTVFVALGASASFLGQFLKDWQDLLSKIAGGIIILFGLHFLGLLKIPLLYKEARYQATDAPAGLAGAYLMGLAFAFGWTPCVGPVLSAVLTVAANEASLSRGVALLTFYSLGLGIPFLIAAAMAGRFLSFFARFRQHLGRVEKVMGVFLIITGIMFLTGSINWFGQWMLDTFPALAAFEEWMTPKSLRGKILKPEG